MPCRGIIRLQELLSAIWQSAQMLTEYPAGEHQMLSYFIPSGKLRPRGSRFGMEVISLQCVFRTKRPKFRTSSRVCFVLDLAVNILNQLMCRVKRYFWVPYAACHSILLADRFVNYSIRKKLYFLYIVIFIFTSLLGLIVPRTRVKVSTIISTLFHWF